MIRLSVTGLDETIARLNQQINNSPVAKRAIHAEMSRFMVNELKRNAHRVSDRMYNSITTESITEQGANVIIPVPYAQKENSRFGDKIPTAKTKGPYGPHNFADRAVMATQNEFVSKIRAGYRTFSIFST